MANEFSITFYKIEKCGIFAPGRPAKHKAMDCEELLTELSQWITHNNKPIEETATFEDGLSDNILPVYCLSIHKAKNSENFLITTWNESASFKGKTLSIEAKKPANNAKVNTSKIPTDSIPGYPTYFWFLPKKGIYATITFNTTLNGNPGLQKYLRNYLEKWTKYSVWDEDDTQKNTLNFLGHKFGSTGEIHEDTVGEFKSHMYPRPSQTKLLLSRYSEIRKIKRKEILKPTDSSSLIDPIIRKLGITTSSPPNELKVEYQVYKTFSKEEVQQILGEFDNNGKDKWDDVGFYLKGRPTPIWASHSTARDTFRLNVKDVHKPILDRQSLIDSLELQESRILKILK
ncbi:MAG: hypothetical protein CMN80_10615 [Spongiibacter sp.]|uniref:hypothetical protein n=1 Tax=Spongiibacter sp. TaxID=2024860 RepID=UPI000C0AE6F0|nr:hypothetical protein [Spongiibacter sp.]MAK44590.1 hypothetical protein [Spongiibacter sp.]